MQKKRLFIAMPLATSVSRSIRTIEAELKRKFEDFPDASVNFVSQENLHLTVSFLGDEDDIMLPVITDAMKIVTQEFEPPEIVFEKISYFPTHGSTAKMIWLTTDRASSERTAKIKDVLDAALRARGVPFQREMKLFSGHVTLARFAKEAELASLPPIERSLQFSFSATSLDLMESELKRPAFVSARGGSAFGGKTSAGKSGAEYCVLQSFEFKE